MIPETQHPINNLSAYELWQLNKYGNIIPSGSESLTLEEHESRDEENETNRINALWEKQLDDQFELLNDKAFYEPNF